MTPVIIHGFWAIAYQVMLVFCWIGSLIFPIWYGMTGLWLKTEMGQHLMAYSTVVAVSMTLVALRPLFADEPLRVSWIGALLVFLLGLVSWWRAWIFYKVRK